MEELKGPMFNEWLDIIERHEEQLQQREDKITEHEEPEGARRRKTARRSGKRA